MNFGDLDFYRDERSVDFFFILKIHRVFFSLEKNKGGGKRVEKTRTCITSKFSEGCFSESLLFTCDMHRNTLSVWEMVEITLTARCSTCVKGTKMTVGMEILQKTIMAGKWTTNEIYTN